MMRFLLIVLVLISPVFVFAQRINYDTAIISSGLRFKIQARALDGHKELFTIAKGEKVILKDTLDQFSNIDFVYFNVDGFIDIQFTFMGNIDTYSLYLFDPMEKVFRRVIDFEKFPIAKTVKNSEGFYYSYHRSGCADNYWTSDLFKIENFKTVGVGKIFGNRCDSPFKVEVFKVAQNKEQLLEIIPYEQVEENKDNKLGFINKYWTKNWSKFQ